MKKNSGIRRAVALVSVLGAPQKRWAYYLFSFRSVLFHVSYMPISCKKTTGVQASTYGNLKRGDPMNAKDFFDGLVKARMRDDLRMRVRYKR